MAFSISDDGKYVDVMRGMDSGDSSSYLVAPKLESTTKAAADTAHT
jgi:ethanolamine utilization microcompartment shell protein EutL